MRASSKIVKKPRPYLTSQDKVIKEKPTIEKFDKKDQISTIDEIFDHIMENAQTEDMYRVIEKDMRSVFSASESIIWIVDFKQKSFISPVNIISFPMNETLLINSLNSKSPLLYKSQQKAPHFSNRDTRYIQACQPILLIPIISKFQKHIAIIELARRPDRPYASHDYSIACYFQRKFTIYLPYLFTDFDFLNIAQDIPHNQNFSQILFPLLSVFHCRTIEVWLYKFKKNIFYKFSNLRNDVIIVEPQHAGIVSEAIKTHMIINLSSPRSHPLASPIHDCIYDEPILMIPYPLNPVDATFAHALGKSVNEESQYRKNRSWVLVLRGKANPTFFTQQDIITASTMAPFIIRTVSAALKPWEIFNHLTDRQKELRILLEIAEALSGVLDIDSLLSLIMEKSCYLLNAQRCSLFLVDKDDLVAFFHYGLAHSFHVRKGTGIVGLTALSGEIINIPDAYKDPRFDPSFDKKTGFKTHSLLTVPIYSASGNIIGVTQMLNKNLKSYSFECPNNYIHDYDQEFNLDITEMHSSNNISSIINSEMSYFLNGKSKLSFFQKSGFSSQVEFQSYSDSQSKFVHNNSFRSTQQNSKRNSDLSDGITAKESLNFEQNSFSESQSESDDEEWAAFDEDDEKLMKAFNVFCGIALDNAKLYRASIDLTSRVRSFVDMSSSLTRSNIRDALLNILENLLKFSGAKEAIFYVPTNGDNLLVQYLFVGESSFHNDNLLLDMAQFVLRIRKPHLFSKETRAEDLIKSIQNAFNSDSEQISQNIFNSHNVTIEGENITTIQENSYFPTKTIIVPTKLSASKNVNSSTKNSIIVVPLVKSRVISALTVEDEGKQINNFEVYGIPLFTSDHHRLGVVLIVATKFISHDIKLLESMCLFAAALMENNNIKDTAKLGQIETLVDSIEDKIERPLIGQIPAKLELNDPELVLDLEPNKFNDLSIIFEIFTRYSILQEFKITNEKFLRFALQVRDMYKDIPFHNWFHAIAVLQFLGREIEEGELVKGFTSLEFLSLFVAGICHDLDYNEFSINDNNLIPLSILFKNQSVLATHHCSVAISIISDDAFNIFSVLKQSDVKIVWTKVIDLILSTDMEKHYEIMKTITDRIKDNNFSFENESDRMLILKLLLKCADVSYITWTIKDVFQYIHEAPKHIMPFVSLEEFYVNICLNMFENATRVIPALEDIYKEAKSNISRWISNDELK